MDALDLARWQFGITTVYHFLFVPLTIGLSMLVAGLQTAWYRTGEENYLRATKFWGKLFLINFAMGVVTGIVQEFQFGMNWSEYSRFVGDIFGAPLAVEALLAFFLESTFLGLWIFGWDRLPTRPAPRHDLAGRHRHDAVGVLHPGRELLDAAPGRLHDQPGHRARRAHRLRRGADQTTTLVTLPARDLLGVPGGRRHHRRRRRLAPGTPPARRGHAHVAAARRVIAARRRRPRDDHRPRPGQDHDRAAADEDGRGRGASTRPQSNVGFSPVHDRHRSTAPRRSGRSESPA